MLPCSLLQRPPMLAKKTIASASLPPSISRITTPPLRGLLSQTHVHTFSTTRRAACLQTSVSTSLQRGFTSLSLRSNTSCTLWSPFERHHLLGCPSSVRPASSSSSSKWLSRQSSDPYARHAKLQNLKSRAAFKLLQINDRYRLFRPGMTVVDLGFAPGSWSQVAIDLVRPGLGRVVGVDVIPVQPPKGVNGIQGDFLSPEVQARVRDFLRDEVRGKLRRGIGDEAGDEAVVAQVEEAGYIDRERKATEDEQQQQQEEADAKEHEGKCVDVVLSDMSAPWDMSIPSWKRSVSNPYRRMMNTTGNRFRDHAGSMDLCRSALYFSYETLKVGGHFVCKFYQGAEDKKFENQLKAMFHKVHREKPESSRNESRESFFVGLKRLAKVDRDKVFDEG